jgi:hypothetical protein
MARLKSISKITLKEMILTYPKYCGLPDGLVQLPVPRNIKISRRHYPVPKDMNEFSKNICYGQRMFLSREEKNDFDLIIRIIDGYYYPIVERKKWDESLALSFGKKVITCKVEEIYPVAMHLVSLINETADRERKLLHREPTKIELAAGIEKLNVFSEMTALDFLRDSMKITVPEVLLTPYNECLVRFMIAKETNDFQERYIELMKEESKPKSKFHAKT